MYNMKNDQLSTRDITYYGFYKCDNYNYLYYEGKKEKNNARVTNLTFQTAEIVSIYRKIYFLKKKSSITVCMIEKNQTCKLWPL